MILLCVFQAGQLRNVWCEYSLHSEQEMKLSVSVNSSKLSKKKERPLAIENFHVSYTRFTRDVIAIKRWREVPVCILLSAHLVLVTWRRSADVIWRTRSVLPHDWHRWMFTSDLRTGKRSADSNSMCEAVNNLPRQTLVLGELHFFMKLGTKTLWEYFRSFVSQNCRMLSIPDKSVFWRVFFNVIHVRF